MQHEREYTEIRLVNENGVYAIRVQRTEMTLDDMWDLIIAPALCAAGYSPDSVKDFVGS